jgi:hypothetical protein
MSNKELAELIAEKFNYFSPNNENRDVFYTFGDALKEILNAVNELLELQRQVDATKVAKFFIHCTVNNIPFNELAFISLKDNILNANIDEVR